MNRVDENNQTVRCFPTKCRVCGKPVLYWENTRGSKVFFEYPVIEKFRQHFCKLPPKIIPEKSFAERQFEIHQQSIFQCPLCGKMFDEEAHLNQHLKDRSRNDPIYRVFFQKILIFNVLEDESEQSENNGKKEWDLGNSSQFGQIRLRKDKKSKPLKNNSNSPS